MSNLRVSVVIPAYRAADTIARAVDSVLAQTVPAHEILVVDDGSPDDIGGALAPYGERVTLLTKENGGTASARNLGIERSSGDLIAFLDADDYWEPHKLERHVELYRRHDELGLSFSRYFEQEPGQERSNARRTNGVSSDRVFSVSGRQAFDLAAKVWTCTVVVPRTVIGSHRFTSGLEPSEDRDLWVRLLLAGPTCCISEPLATAVLEDGSISRSDIDWDCTSMLRVVHKYSDLLGSAGVHDWEANEYRRWAADYLARGKPAAAAVPALRRLKRQPLSPEAWWIVFKSVTLAGLRPRSVWKQGA